MSSIITFRVSRRRREMYCGHARLCVCLSVCLSAAACLHYCTDPDVTRVSGRGCPLVVHCWADLQSVHGLRCCGNITRTRNVSEYMLVLALCLVWNCKHSLQSDLYLNLIRAVQPGIVDTNCTKITYFLHKSNILQRTCCKCVELGLKTLISVHYLE